VKPLEAYTTPCVFLDASTRLNFDVRIAVVSLWGRDHVSS